MKENWRTYKLGDLVTFQRGHDLSKDEFVEGEFPIAGSNGIIGYHNTFTTKGPGITIGRSGNIGNPYYYPTDFWAHNTTLYVKEFKNCNPKFIYYLLKTLDFGGHNSGSAVPSLNRNYIHPIEVIAPERIEEQAEIASILSSLDDKIELNHQMNRTLESLAQTLFKEWFVNFNFPGFDGELVDGLPKGWKKMNITELVNTVSVTHKFPKGEAIFLNTSDILEGEFLTEQYSKVETLPGQAKKTIQYGDILFSEIRPANKRYAFVDFVADDYVVSTKLMVLRSKGVVDNLFIYYVLKSDDVLNQLQVLAETRSGTFPQITYTELSKVDTVIPDKQTETLFLDMLQSLHFRIRENQRQNKTISAIRDNLLPKLMSGKIEIKA